MIAKKYTIKGLFLPVMTASFICLPFILFSQQYFVTSTATLTGASAGIAKDIDFDYAGNIYVVGGGDRNAQKLAKFDKDGNLLWTFNGILTSPDWHFGDDRGGWTVDRSTGKVYLGQGETGLGPKIIRLNGSGNYDGFISRSNGSFRENWKMLWICNNNLPGILIGGGGGTPNELGMLAPPDTIPAALNISGYTNGNNDVSDIIVDEKTNELYSIFAVPFNTPGLENRIHKHTTPYTNTTKIWSNSTGFSILNEPENRPYVGGVDNSSNCLAVNNNYLFYWDGRNLKAFNKTFGDAAGLSLIFSSNTALMTGGIYADDCGNVYIGWRSGIIKVLKFNGSFFDDVAAADIQLSGVAGDVYDIIFDRKNNHIYACGNNFVASVQQTEPCPAASPVVYNLTVIPDNVYLSAKAIVAPATNGTNIYYSLHDSISLISTNTTGIFTELICGVRYTMKAVIKNSCDSILLFENFTLTAASLFLKNNILIPSAFSPNGDGTNDVLHVIARGIRELRYFNIYNRYGQLLFTTKDRNKGWDGNYKGKVQNTGTYIWMVEAIDSKGKLVQQKGTTIIIR